MAKINLHTATKYQGDMPVRYLNHCANGGSTPQFCKDISIGRDTFIDWCNKYPDMMAAKKKGKLLAEGWWIEQAQNHLVIHNAPDEGTTKFDTSLYKFIMSGRFGHTSDNALRKEVIALHEAIAALKSIKTSSQYAPEAECEPDDNNKTE